MTSDFILVLLFFFVLVLPAFGFYLYFMGTIYHHELTRDSIRIRLMGLVTLRKVELSEIQSIEVVSGWELPDPTIMFYAEKWPGKFGNEGVLVRIKSGLSRVLLISPENPREFVENVNRLQGENKLRKEKERKGDSNFSDSAGA